MKIILDNGHGRETAGKCSPDGRLLEYAYTRELVRQFGLAVFDGRTRISNIARFSLRVVSNDTADGVDFSFTFEKGKRLKVNT